MLGEMVVEKVCFFGPYGLLHLKVGKNTFSESHVHVGLKECWVQTCAGILTLLGMLESCKLILKRENSS